MEKVGIIVAMQEELEAIENVMQNKTKKQIHELKFIEGNIQDEICVLVKCGIGKVNAARVTQMLIDEFNPKYIINLGSAGSVNSNLDIGDIVIGKILVQHDFDITAFGHSKGYITGVGEKINSDHQLVERFENAVKNIDDKTYKIKTGVIATGDIFCTEVSMKDKVRSKFNADCLEMEGAAIAQVCHLDNIPFIVVRSISDSPNGKNAIIFDQFIRLASKRCADILKEFFREDK